MGVVYYKYRSEKEIYSMPLVHASISASELKQLILASDHHGRGRNRGRGPRESITISNAQTGEALLVEDPKARKLTKYLKNHVPFEYTDENAMILQNTTVLVRRIAGQLRNVTEGSFVPSNKSVLTDSISKSLSLTEVLDEDAAITAVIDAAELKLEDQQFKKAQAGGRFMSGSRYGHGPLERETSPPGYICRNCRVPGHFIQHCMQEIKKPPCGYICYSFQIPGHFIQHCPTAGDPKFVKNKMTRPLAPVITPTPVDGILDSHVSAASASAVDFPAELYYQLCKKVMADALLTSKCCFDSFYDKCIRYYIIKQSKCICGAKVLADSLIPNHTLRSTISNMLSARTGSVTSGITKHRSSSGSNTDPKFHSHAPSAASEWQEIKHHLNQHVSEAAAPDGGLQVAAKDDLVNQPQEELPTNVHPLSKDEVKSAIPSVENVATSAKNLKLQVGSVSALKVTTVSGTLEQNATKIDQPKKKRKKAGSTKIAQPNNSDFGYNVPVDPAYYNPLVGGYPWVTEPYIYGSMGMLFGGYPMGPYGVNPISIMPPPALPMHGYPPNYHRQDSHPTLQRGTEAAAHSRLLERPKDSGIQFRPSECSRQQGSRGSELRNRTRSSRERREHRRSDRASDDYYEDHNRKRMHAFSPMDGEKQSSWRSRHSSRSMTREDSSDDERNFKRRWGSRFSLAEDSRH